MAASTPNNTFNKTHVPWLYNTELVWHSSEYFVRLFASIYVYGRQIVCRRFDKWFVGDCRRLAPHQTSIWIIWSGSIGPLFSMDEKTRKLYHKGDGKCETSFESTREINWTPFRRLALGLRGVVKVYRSVRERRKLHY